MSTIIQEAKQRIYDSDIINYIGIDKIEEAFSKIFIFNNSKEFYKAYGLDDYNNERLEGFNRSNGNYLNPDYATAHTVIHEVLHGISSEFDNQGHRIKNGIMGEQRTRFGNQVNEGCTDYLASKLSGESPRNYMQGHKLFSKLEPIIVKYSKDSDILMKMYLKNDVKFLRNFLDRYGKKETFESLYDNFLFMDDEKIDNMISKINKNVNKDLKKQKRKENISNIAEKFKKLFSRKNQKLLSEENKNVNQSENQIDKHKEFLKEYQAYNISINAKMKNEQHVEKNKEEQER